MLDRIAARAPNVACVKRSTSSAVAPSNLRFIPARSSEEMRTRSGIARDRFGYDAAMRSTPLASFLSIAIAFVSAPLFAQPLGGTQPGDLTAAGAFLDSDTCNQCHGGGF